MTDSTDGRTLIDVDADVGRANDASENMNLLDTRTKMFVNCGAWHDGATDFTLISKQDIVLCSWLPGPNDHVEYGSSFDISLKGNDKIISFLRASQRLDPPRGFVRNHGFSPGGVFKFSEDDELIVFMGDCHINLLKEWGPDGFIKHPSQEELDKGRTRVSLFYDFEHFVQFANQHTDKERIIQIGDLFDVWEAQNVFEGAANALRNLIESFARAEGMHLSDPIGATEKTYVTMYSDMLTYSAFFENCMAEAKAEPWRNKDVTPIALAKYFRIPIDQGHFGRSWRSKRDERELKINHGFYHSMPTLRDALALLFYGNEGAGLSMSRYAMPKQFPSDLFLGNLFCMPMSKANCHEFLVQVVNIQGYDEPMDFLDFSALKSAIKRQYVPEDCTDGGDFWTTFTAIEGNHDMEVENRYLNEVFRDGASTRRQAKEKFGNQGSIKPKTWVDPDLKLDIKKISGRCGKNECILYEHGHAWDPYNNELNYDLFDITPLQPWLYESIGPLELAKLHGGFHACRGWTVGDTLIFGDVGYDGDFKDAALGTNPNRWESGKIFANLKAIEALELGNHARAFAIFESTNDQCKTVRLIVMGHSHNPIIVKRYRELKNSAFDEWKDRKK